MLELQYGQLEMRRICWNSPTMRRLAILTVTGGVVGVNIFFNNHFISMSSEETIPSSSSTSSKCPVAFLWNWSGSSLPSLPAGHPIISKNIDDEKPAVFNSSHFPNGVNANFLGSDPQTCAAKFAGPNGLFECESRQIKKYAPNIINTLKSYGLNEGSIVGDVGAGTGYSLVMSFLIYNVGVLTRLLSRIVGPNGTVIAEELAPSFLTLLEEEKKKTPSMRNVTLVQGTNKQINFPNDLKCDLIVVCDVYHHFEYPVTTIR